MKRSLSTFLLAVTLLSAATMFWVPTEASAQYVPTPVPSNGAASAAVGPVGVVTAVNSTSSYVVNISPGPIFCQGDTGVIAPTQLTLSNPNMVSNSSIASPTATWFISFGCSSNSVVASVIPSPQQPANLLLATVVVGCNTCLTQSNDIISITANTGAAMFPNANDGFFFVPESSCGGAITGTAGAGNATDIVALSGGLRVFRLSNTNAGASNNTFTCTFNVPSRLTAGKGAQILDIVFPVSTQTTQPTSVITPTLKSFTPPLAVDPETANSATFVAFGGTITFAPTTAQFAAYTAVAAGQFFTVRAILGTPTFVNNDLQTFVVTFQFNQSAAAAGVQETPGFYVHYVTIPL